MTAEMELMKVMMKVERMVMMTDTAAMMGKISKSVAMMDGCEGSMTAGERLE